MLKELIGINNLETNVTSLFQTGEHEKALELCNELLKTNSDNPLVWHYLGMSYFFSKRYDESIHAYQKAIDMKPDWVWKSIFNQSHAYLIQDDYLKGFEKFQARIRFSNNSPHNMWEGQDIRGKTLLVFAEDGGLGDALMFCRYVPYIEKQFGCKVHMKVQPELRSFFQNLDVTIVDIPQGMMGPCDYFVFIGSLPYCFHTTIASLFPPLPIPCNLRPTKGKIAIVWKSIVKNDGVNSTEREVAAHHLIPLLQLQGFQWVSAQKFVSSEDAQLLDAFGVERPPIHSFEDTIKILQTCEKLICIDTSILHVAGSIGLPTWLLVPYDGSWRWGIQKTYSSWYPFLRLFRQQKFGNWDQPIQDIKKGLLSADTFHKVFSTKS